METTGYEIAAKWHDKCNELEAESNKFREALKFYADKNNAIYEKVMVAGKLREPIILKDRGKIAKEALGEKK